jgi:hypothetical protein
MPLDFIVTQSSAGSFDFANSLFRGQFAALRMIEYELNHGATPESRNAPAFTDGQTAMRPGLYLIGQSFPWAVPARVREKRR